MRSDGFCFEDLVGEEFDFFYGASEPFFKLDDTVYEVQDNGEAIEAEGPTPDFGLPIARVIVAYDDEHDGMLYKLVDLHDEHCWLRFGVACHDTSERSYDAIFTFEYTPKGCE